tara:strand:+ start:2246 stop:2836 length:591 start_codon:yes stop_codon:yes gene_type:complete
MKRYPPPDLLKKKTTIINIFGGPGIGKSTQAAGLHYIMKKNGMSVELTSEFAKDISWEKNYSAINDQLYITATQHRNISRVYGQVDYIIVDSPILNGLIYKKRYQGTIYPTKFYGEHFDRFVLDLFSQYDNINILLRRNDEIFQKEGRFQDLKGSKEIDMNIKNLLITNDVKFQEYNVDFNTVNDIYRDVFRNSTV